MDGDFTIVGGLPERTRVPISRFVEVDGVNLVGGQTGVPLYVTGPTGGRNFSVFVGSDTSRSYVPLYKA